MKAVALTDAGMDHAEKLLREKGLLGATDSLYEMEQVMIVHHVNQALRAHTLFQKDVDYIVQNNQVVIIDEFTGRMMPGRRFGEGLHQALEAKEHAEIQNENQTLASITFQNFFRMYDKLSGMTGTADTEAEEFESIYGLQVIVVPTHVGVSRDDEVDIIYRTKEEKQKAIIYDIKQCYERGQPILVGTTSIDTSEAYSEILKKANVKHQVLNARYHEKESEIIAQAGRLGAVTIATNMAGRGTDIKLGGSLELLLEEANGDEAKIQEIKDAHEREKQDVLKLGGLRVLGTERHESRRIDNQLRGRSGRQGDPGSSVFYISLQDDLMRIFAKGLDTMMERLDMPENEAIQSRLVTTAIETAQKKIEGRNFESRKTVLKYDDVLNDQRGVIYEQRNDILKSETVDDVVIDYREETLANLVNSYFPMGTYKEQWDIEGFKTALFQFFNVKPNLDEWLAKDDVDAEDILDHTKELVDGVWKAKEERITSEILRQVEKSILTQTLDHQWKEHLQRLDTLRQGIHLRGYGQKDPLNEFKKEAFVLFEHLMDSIRENTVKMLSHIELQKSEDAQEAIEMSKPQPMGFAGEVVSEREQSVLSYNHGEIEDEELEENPYANQGVPRNAPCPCGNGKKYKHCHGKVKKSA